MIFTPTNLSGAFVIEPELRQDDRGHFARTFCQQEFARHGLEEQLVQGNMAFSRQVGVTRGMHYQNAPNAETKLVRCTRGRVFDAMVDLREDSATYRQWFGIELNTENNLQLYVPRGFAHGYQVLEADSELSYLVSAFYSPESEAGIRWDDPAIGIDWPIKDNVELSEKDQQWSLLS